MENKVNLSELSVTELKAIAFDLIAERDRMLEEREKQLNILNEKMNLVLQQIKINENK